MQDLVENICGEIIKGCLKRCEVKENLLRVPLQIKDAEKEMLAFVRPLDELIIVPPYEIIQNKKTHDQNQQIPSRKYLKMRKFHLAFG